jgi:cysteine sulfinate desulfinase/cysteine desulfurase-like protein
MAGARRAESALRASLGEETTQHETGLALGAFERVFERKRRLEST